MTTDPYAQWRGAPMDDTDTEALLGAAGHGVLGLADDDDPYTIPVSFGYESGAIFFAFIRDGPNNEKFDYIADGDPARLLVTDIKARFDWQSVAVDGTVESVDLAHDDWDTLVASLEDNPWFSTAFDDADEVEGVQGWRLVPDSVSGLQVRPTGE